MTTTNNGANEMTRQINRALTTARDARNDLAEDRNWTGRKAGATRYLKRTVRRAERRAARLEIAAYLAR